MSVHSYETPSGARNWRVRWRDANGKLRSQSFPTQAEAKRRDAEIKTRRTQGEFVGPPQKESLGDAFELWFDLRGDGLSPATRAVYRSLWRAHSGGIAGEKVTTLASEPLLIERHMKHLEDDGVGRAARRKFLMILSAVFKACKRWRWISHNPVSEMERPSAAPEKNIRPFSPILVERIRGYLLDQRGDRGLEDAALVSVLAYAGLRPQEALALRWGDIENSTIGVDRAVVQGESGPEIAGTKTGRARRVKIPEPLVEDLDALKASRTKARADDLVFPSSTGGLRGKSATANWRRRVWRPAVAAVVSASSELALYSDARPYDCRSAYVSLQLRSGASPVDVAASAGHSLPVMYRHYAGVIEDLIGEPPVSVDSQIRTARELLASKAPSEIESLTEESLKPPREIDPRVTALLYGRPQRAN